MLEAYPALPVSFFNTLNQILLLVLLYQVRHLASKVKKNGKENIKLRCLIDGQPQQAAFTVTIGKSRAVSSLGKLIKDKNPIDFKGFDSFKLWPAQLRLGSSAPDFHRFALDTTDKAPLELGKRISS